MFDLWSFYSKKRSMEQNHFVNHKQNAQLYQERFFEKLIYLYQNSDKILLLLYYSEETDLTIADLAALLFQNKELSKIYCYKRIDDLIHNSEFDPVEADTRMKCAIYLLDAMYHILDDAFQNIDSNIVAEEIEDCYEQQLEYLTIALTLFQNIRQYSYLEEWFDVRDSFFEDGEASEYYQELKAQAQFLHEPYTNDLIKQIYRNNDIASDEKVVETLAKRIEKIEFSNRENQKQYIR